MEKINMKKLICQAKLVGTILTVAGVMLMSFYKGPIVELLWTKDISHSNSNATNNTRSSSKNDWLLGSIFLTISTIAWASFFVLQVRPHDN